MISLIKSFMLDSKTWTTIRDEPSLIASIAATIASTLSIDAGIFVYQEESMPGSVAHVFGLPQAKEELLACFSKDKGLLEDDNVDSETWISVDKLPESRRHIWMQAGIQQISVWPISIRDRRIGGIVMGRREKGFDDAQMLSVCMIYTSTTLELIQSRYRAFVSSHHDALTGVLNRRGFLSALKQATQRSDSIILGIVDVDDFKDINDHHGHVIGDAVLCDIADFLKHNIQDGLCARLGGDEFVFACATDESPEEISRRLMSSFSDKKYSISVGCALWGREGDNFEQCFHVADERLYQYRGIAFDNALLKIGPER